MHTDTGISDGDVIFLSVRGQQNTSNAPKNHLNCSKWKEKKRLNILKCQALNVWLKIYLICEDERVLIET